MSHKQMATLSFPCWCVIRWCIFVLAVLLVIVIVVVQVGLVHTTIAFVVAIQIWVCNLLLANHESYDTMWSHPSAIIVIEALSLSPCLLFTHLVSTLFPLDLF